MHKYICTVELKYVHMYSRVEISTYECTVCGSTHILPKGPILSMIHGLLPTGLLQMVTCSADDTGEPELCTHMNSVSK